MIPKQMLEELLLELPDKASDIKEAILMLADIIDESIEDLIKVSNSRLGSKEYKESIEVIKLIESLDNARDSILSQIVDLELPEPNTTPEIDTKLTAPQVRADSKEKVDYSLYCVDNEIPHDLTEIYKFKRPYAFSWQGKKHYATSFKAILLRVANNLLNVHGDEFRNLTDNELFIGRKNKMISSNPAELLDPKLLEDNKTYIFSCLSSDSIVRLIRKFLDYFNYDIEDFKIYLRADYNDLHNE